MLSPEEYADLSIHKEALLLYHVHNYVPRGENGSIMAINHIYSKKFNRPPVDIWCSGCLTDLMRIMYNELQQYEKQKAIEGTVVQPTETEAKEIAEVIQTEEPQQKKKRPRINKAQ